MTRLLDLHDDVSSPVVEPPDPSTSGRRPRRGSRDIDVTLRLMTYNIERGTAWPSIREQIRRQAVDIVCLQEVPEESCNFPDCVRPSRIVKELGWAQDFRLLRNRPPRQVGNMTLVRRGKIRAGEILRVPVTPPYGCVSLVDIDGARLAVANLHLTPVMGPPPVAFPISEILRLRELRHFARKFGGKETPIVAAGDFNTFWPAPGCWVMRRRWQDCRAAVSGRHNATRPTYGLPFVIDHIFIRGGIRVLDYEVLPDGGSDHRAVVATLALPIPCDSQVGTQND